MPWKLFSAGILSVQACETRAGRRLSVRQPGWTGGEGPYGGAWGACVRAYSAEKQLVVEHVQLDIPESGLDGLAGATPLCVRVDHCAGESGGWWLG